MLQFDGFRAGLCGTLLTQTLEFARIRVPNIGVAERLYRFYQSFAIPADPEGGCGRGGRLS